VLGLALDEPLESDRRYEVQGLRFVIDDQLARSMERYLPIQVDHDARYWAPFRLRVTRATNCG
jgi:hypothetical protein